MKLIIVLFFFLVACDVGEPDKGCSVNGDGNQVNCNANDSSNIEDNSIINIDAEHKSACCDCFGNDEDGLSDETCLEVTGCPEIYILKGESVCFE